MQSGLTFCNKCFPAVGSCSAFVPKYSLHTTNRRHQCSEVLSGREQLGCFGAGKCVQPGPSKTSGMTALYSGTRSVGHALSLATTKSWEWKWGDLTLRSLWDCDCGEAPLTPTRSTRARQGDLWGLGQRLRVSGGHTPRSEAKGTASFSSRASWPPAA